MRNIKDIELLPLVTHVIINPNFLYDGGQPQPGLNTTAASLLKQLRELDMKLIFATAGSETVLDLALDACNLSGFERMLGTDLQPSAVRDSIALFGFVRCICSCS